MKYRIIGLYIFFLLVTCSTASAWLSGWDYRMPIEINNTGDNLTDFQYDFTVNTTTLVVDGKMNANGSDCRITDETDVLQPFWNETVFNDSNTKIWVNASALSNVTNTTHYMYYGKSAAITAAVGDDTFMFFDNFTTNSVGGVTSSFGNWAKNRATYTVGDYAYVTHYQGLSILNISDSTNPVFLSNLAFGTYVLDIVVDGNYAYMSDSEDDAIYIVNISDPYNPVEVGNVTNTTYLNFNHGISKQDEYLICCAFSSHSLTIVNVSDVVNPVIEGYVVDTTNLKWIHDVVVDGDYAYVACHGGGVSSNGTVSIVNISIKNNPVIVSSIFNTGLCHASDIQKKGDFCYVGTWPGSGPCGGSGCYIKVINVSDVNNMVEVGSLAGSRGYILDIYGDYLYSANGEGVYTTYPFDVIDISDPTSPTLHKRYSGISCTAMRHVKITPDGKYAILADHVEPASTSVFYIVNLDEKWDDVAGTPVVSGGYLELQNGDRVRASGYSIQHARCKFKSKKSSTSSGLSRIGLSNALTGSGFYSDDAAFFYKSTTADIKAATSNEGVLGGSDSGINYVANTPQTYEILWKSGEVKILINNILGDIYTTNIPDEVLNPRAEMDVSAATEYIDWYFVAKYTSPEPTTSLGSEESALGSPTVELLSQTPSVLYQNSTGTFNLTWGITHSASGLNNSSISFVYTIWDIVNDHYNNSIRPPNNNKAAYSDIFGEYILRANNRNETLNFENNVTITEGNIWKWGGMDENSTELTIEQINSTYTKVHINTLIHDHVFNNMWYLDRSSMQAASKTQYAIYKDHGALIKFWDTEAAVDHVHLGCAHLDTGLGAVEPTPANPIEIWYVNKSYNSAGSVAVEDSPYAFYMTSLTKDNWVDYVYSPHANSSYARCITINSTDIENAGINVTDTAYLYLTSQTNSNRPFYLNMTNVSSGTNVSFADANVMWSGTAPFAQVNYTPNMFITMIHDNYQYQAKLYTAGNNDLWGNSTLHTSNVEVSIFPPTKPSLHHILYDGAEYQNSAIDNQTFNGIVDVAVGVSTDPDGGIVTHNLTLHYQNGDLVTIINNTFTEPIDTFAEIVFNTTSYYSDTQGYVLRIVATDDEAYSQTTWMNYTFFLNPIPVSAEVVESYIHRSAASGELLNVTIIDDERAKFVINLAGLYDFIIGDEPSEFIQWISEWLQGISDYTLVQHISEVGESKPFWCVVGCLSLGMFLSGVTDKNPKIKAKPAATIGFVGVLISSIYLGLFAIVI